MLKSNVVFLSTTSYVRISQGYLTIGVINSTTIRLELGCSGLYLFNTSAIESYNRIITIHGLGMIFIFIMPTLISFAGNWLVPQTYNAYDFALPRINLSALWLLNFSVLLVVNSILREEGVASGWTLYVPLSDGTYSSSSAMSLFIFCIHILGLSSQGGSVTFLASILLSRMYGLLSSNQTLFTWCIATVSVLLITTLPVLGAGVTSILLDRLCNTGLLHVSSGGDPILFQHMFWFFGHPEVYVIILPAFGILSLIISENSSRSAFGNSAMLWAILSIAFIGYFVWAHHMFSTGMSIDTRLYFSAATSIIAIPTAVKIYSWSLSILSETVRRYTTLRTGFLVCFTLGGFTGLVLANSTVDLYYHDTYYVVAHFHYVLSIGALFASIIIIRLYQISILPVATTSTWEHIVDLLLTWSVNILFLILHELGRDGHPRRIPVSTESSLLSGNLSNTGLWLLVLLSGSTLGHCNSPTTGQHSLTWR